MTMTLTELEGRITITVEEAGALIGVRRSAAYEAARRGDLPTRRVGRRLVVPVPAFLRWLGNASATDDGGVEAAHEPGEITPL